MTNLSKLQKEIVTTTAQKALIISSAGSGKTLTLTSRCQHLLDSGVDPAKIVLITFTTAAAEEMLDRLNQPQGLFVGTIHAYANYLLLSDGTDTSDILNSEDFDDLFHRVKSRMSCVKPVEHLLLDEGQDSTKLQMEFMLEVVNPQNWMIFSDHRQSIYRFLGANPEKIIELSHDPEVTVFHLNENYRNSSTILNFARSIIRKLGPDYYDGSQSQRPQLGQVLQGIDYSPRAIAKSILERGKESGEYKDWFILTRTNEQLEEICRALTVVGVPHSTFKKAELSNKQLNEKMKENTVKVLTIHTAKGLEANNVVVVGAKFYSPEEICISYVAATRARDLLVWTKMINKGRARKITQNWET